jgi:hypothetical protein
MATGTAPVIPRSGAAAATTKNTMPAVPSLPLLSEVPDELSDIRDFLLIEFKYR